MNEDTWKPLMLNAIENLSEQEVLELKVRQCEPTLFNCEYSLHENTEVMQNENQKDHGHYSDIGSAVDPSGLRGKA